jgi:tetratricopeptide (TPR) repeat protein
MLTKLNLLLSQMLLIPQPRLALTFAEASIIHFRKLGARDPILCLGLSHCATVHVVLGNFSQACSLMDECLDHSKESLGWEARASLSCMYNLASLHRVSGRLELAESMFIDCMKLRSQIIGDHFCFSVTNACNHLALLYVSQGKEANAIAVLEKCLAENKAKHGRDNDHTLASMSNLLSLQVSLGIVDSQDVLLKEILLIHAYLGQQHVYRRVEEYRSKQLMEKKGDYDTGEKLYVTVIDFRRKLLASKDPTTSFAEIYLPRRRVLGSEYLDAWDSINNLAVMFWIRNMGDYAERILRQLLATAVTLEATKDAGTLTYAHNLEIMFRSNDRAM